MGFMVFQWLSMLFHKSLDGIYKKTLQQENWVPVHENSELRQAVPPSTGIFWKLFAS